MQLTPDVTLLIQVVTFLVLWFGLKRLVFDPMHRVLDAREQRTIGTQDQAAQLVASAETACDDYGKTIHDLRVELAQASAAARSAAQEEHNRTLADERAAATRELTAMRAALAEQFNAARETLSADAERIASDMLQRVSGEVQA